MNEVIDQVYKRLFALNDGLFLKNLGVNDMQDFQSNNFAGVDVVENVEAFEAHFDDGSLEDLLLELRNRLFDLAGNASKEAPHQLNDVGKFMKAGLESEFGAFEIPNADNSGVGFGPSRFVSTANWIFTSYAQEQTLRSEYQIGASTAFEELTTILERGHFPCGWQESVTQGKLFVF